MGGPGWQKAVVGGQVGHPGASVICYITYHSDKACYTTPKVGCYVMYSVAFYTMSCLTVQKVLFNRACSKTFLHTVSWEFVTMLPLLLHIEILLHMTLTSSLWPTCWRELRSTVIGAVLPNAPVRRTFSTVWLVGLAGCR